MNTQRSGTLLEEAPVFVRVEDLDPAEVRQQVERIVSSKHFRNSKRYPPLLRFVVEQTIAGRADLLKERTLGMTVFERPSDYDTNADPIVRVTAGEIRKRIAQYYQEPGHGHELRIDLPLGSYIPRFELPAPHTEAAHREPSIEPADPPATTGAPVASPAVSPPLSAPLAASAVPESAAVGTALAPAAPRRRMPWLAAALVLSLAGALGLPSLKGLSSRAMDPASAFLWKPLVASSSPVLIVLGVHTLDSNGDDLPASTNAGVNNPGPRNMLSAMVRSNMVPISDIVSYSRATDLLTRHAQAYRTRGSDETTLEEMRGSPVLLMGGLDNAWTMRLTATLRYRFFASDKTASEIVDSQHPSTFWRFDNMQGTLGSSRDYAIVASYFDPNIGQHVLVVAGIGMAGTEAAAEFVTSSDELKSWMAGFGSRDRNVELVLSTEILDGQPGPPHVIAVSHW